MPAPVTAMPSPPTSGTSTTFDSGLAGFSAAYADQNELDHAALVKAIADGRVEATTGI